jgi:lactoylglutathione lyase
LWQDIFGLEKHSSHRIESENVEEDIIKLGPAPYEVEIDLMRPIDPEKRQGIMMKSRAGVCDVNMADYRVSTLFVRVHKPLESFGLWVDNLPQAVDWMQQQGVRFTPGGIRTGAAGHDVVFIHPKGSEEHPISGNGVLIELVQAPANVIDSFK